MQDKLQELTDRLYNEGLSKGKQEGEELLQKAHAEAEAIVAKAKGVKIVGLTGSKESKLSALADICIQVPETETYKIQELHLPVYHCLCLMLEERFFG